MPFYFAFIERCKPNLSLAEALRANSALAGHAVGG